VALVDDIRRMVEKADRPSKLFLEVAAQNRLIERYERLLESWSRVLASMALHATELAAKVRPVGGGFEIPYGWQADIPPVCDLNVIEDTENRVMVVRVLSPIVGEDASIAVNVSAPDGDGKSSAE
jgi:hypothetical protein